KVLMGKILLSSHHCPAGVKGRKMPQNLANLLSAENVIQCDQLIHKHHTLHNRQTTMHGFYKYIPPTEFVKLHDDKHIICEQ
ncbi:hypothetical protein M9458_058040, partial [Cirrhinus mrigala]